jgi:uncharacterized protein (DUF2236 family)
LDFFHREATLANQFQRYVAKRFRRIIANSPDGVPPWLTAVAAGEDAGLFLPTDAPWVVHGDLATLIGGIRALLMQALHPGTLAGVATHSRYETDPLGRLAGTTRWLTVTTFGSLAAIDQEANRVNQMHNRVTGSYLTGSNEARNYRASDPDLLLWVHIAFTNSFLTAHELFGAEPIPGGSDNYVAQWAKSVTRLRLTEVPMSKAELDDQIKSYFNRGELSINENTKKVIGFIQKPPLPKVASLVYASLYQAAVASIPKNYRDLLQIKSLPLWLIRPLIRAFMFVLAKAIGPESPIEEAALTRLRRLGAI